MQDTVQFIPAAELPHRAWNGDCGSVCEIARLPDEAAADAFLWQISAAEIRRAGPLTQYADTDRILMLTEGEALDLQDTESGQTKALEHGARLYFAGEVPYRATPAQGPVQTFNLLFRRKVAHGCVDLRHGTQNLPMRPGETVIYGLRGDYQVDLPKRLGGRRRLQAGDVLRITLDYVPAFRLDVAPLTADARLVDARINLYPGAL